MLMCFWHFFKLGLAQGLWHFYKWETMTSIGYLQWSCSVTTGYWRIARYEYVQSKTAAFIIFSIIVLLRRPAYSTNTETVRWRFLVSVTICIFVCMLWQIFLLLAEATPSVHKRREHTCYPLHTQTHADMICVGQRCVYGVSVRIIKYLIRGLWCAQSRIKGQQLSFLSKNNIFI